MCNSIYDQMFENLHFDRRMQNIGRMQFGPIGDSNKQRIILTSLSERFRRMYLNRGKRTKANYHATVYDQDSMFYSRDDHFCFSRRENYRILLYCLRNNLVNRFVLEKHMPFLWTKGTSEDGDIFLKQCFAINTHRFNAIPYGLTY